MFTEINLDTLTPIDRITAIRDKSAIIVYSGTEYRRHIKSNQKDKKIFATRTFGRGKIGKVSTNSSIVHYFSDVTVP